MSSTQEKAAPPQTRESLLEEWSKTPSQNIDPATWWQRKAFDLAEVNKELLEALERWKKLVPISRGSGPCSSVPCFDEFDYAAEHERKGWLIFDETEFKEATQITEAAIAKARGRQL